MKVTDGRGGVMADNRGIYERYICIYSPNNDGISNVGFFDASSKEDAMRFAWHDWGLASVRDIYAFPVMSLQDGWSWYR